MRDRLERRLTTRHTSPDRHEIVSARIKPGRDVQVIDVSAGGALIESHHRLLPGSSIELQLATPRRLVAVRGCVLRCFVARLCAPTLLYRGAIGFDRYLPWYVEDDPAGQNVPTVDVRHRGAGRAPTTQIRVGSRVLLAGS